MFNFLVAVFDIPLICVLIMLALSALLFARNIYNIFLSLFVSILLVIFISSTIIIQQAHLGEFLIVSIFFLFAIIFFIFNLHNDYNNTAIDNKPDINTKLNLMILVFFIVFLLIGMNFYKISKTQSEYIVRNINYTQNMDIRNYRNNNGDAIEYAENISLLNQNKLFQKLTHIAMLYVCIVTILYFFNRRDEDER